MTDTTSRLLHIEASPRGSRSRSAAVARHLIERLPAGEVETLDLFSADLPAFDGEALEGRYALIAGKAVDPAVQDTWDQIAALVSHFLSFDTVVFSVPMWNFGVPWRLKQYIDLLTQPGLAFTVRDGAVAGLGEGRRAILVTSGALDIRPGGAGAELDFQLSYMKAWLGFIGITDVHAVQVRPTYGSAEDVEAAMTTAYQDAGALAADLPRAPRV